MQDLASPDKQTTSVVGKNRFDSPVKAVPTESALGKPCKSFSFDENFALDDDYNWSPVAMGNT